MSVLSSTYLEDLPDLERNGECKNDFVTSVHIAKSFWEHIHISLEHEEQYVEVNMTIENAELIVEALQLAIVHAAMGRTYRTERKTNND